MSIWIYTTLYPTDFVSLIAKVVSFDTPYMDNSKNRYGYVNSVILSFAPFYIRSYSIKAIYLKILIVELPVAGNDPKCNKNICILNRDAINRLDWTGLVH